MTTISITFRGSSLRIAAGVSRQGMADQCIGLMKSSSLLLEKLFDLSKEPVKLYRFGVKIFTPRSKCLFAFTSKSVRRQTNNGNVRAFRLCF